MLNSASFRQRSLMRRFLVLLALLAPLAYSQQFDLLILNGRVLDGAGNPWFRADVGVCGDEIVALGNLSRASAERTVDAKGHVVSPGFIDTHNHSSRRILQVPASENFVRQGVTTVVEGNDGGSPLPLEPFFEKVRAARPSINYASFIGHGSVRQEIIGAADRKATDEELEQMRNLVRRGMAQGALGLSTGLFYVPGAFASTEEVIELARVAAESGGIHISHMREEASGLIDSVNETIRIGEEGGLPTQLTHHKAVGPPNWGKSAETLELVEQARERGVDVSVDQYPYTASHTGSAAMFEKWVQADGREAMNQRLSDPKLRARIIGEVAETLRVNRGGGDPKNVQFSNCDWDPSLNGKTLADATRRAGREVTFETAAQTAVELQLSGGCLTVYHAMNEEDVERIMAYPGTMIASDGGVIPFGEGVPHPRYYGTFPRVLGRYVREKGVLGLPDAVRKMTSLPSQRVGFFDRGLIRRGMKADIVIFDPDTIIDRAQFGDSHKYAEGVSYVIVNGEVVLDDGEMSDARPGRILRGPAYTD